MNETTTIKQRVMNWLNSREDWLAAAKGGSRLALALQWDDVAKYRGAESPSALGCLLALVREAWGDPGAYARLSGGGGWVCYVGSGAGHVGARPFRAPSEAESLIAALEAAP
jgi:hypothetical protein